MGGASVLLVSLPWTSLTEPSLGLGILRAVLDRKRVPCRVLHLNLFLLQHLRASTYYTLANVFALNDFLFSGVLDPVITPDQYRRLRQKAEELTSYGLIEERQYGGLDGLVEQLCRLRTEVIPRWLTRWAEEISGSDSTLVGFTCMFDQTIASVALARLVKERSPQKMIVLGGYAVRSPTGDSILRAFDCIDAICVGEGEPVIELLARASVGDLMLSEIPSVLYKDMHGQIVATDPAPLVDMNTIPTPNYDDFFLDVKTLSEDHEVDIEVTRIPIENSRGCWWGQTKHCVFCGINIQDITYRSRQPSRALEEMHALSSRYGLTSFRFSDYILPHEYYDTLLPAMEKSSRPYRVQAEIKSNVNAMRMHRLAAAGFYEVQPGIESFSSSVLRKMEKGVSAIQNVYVLLLGKLYSVVMRYNILYGMPNDEAEEYEEMVANLQLLFHLDPPSTRMPVQITRFARLHIDPSRFDIEPAQHHPSYRLIFSRQFVKAHSLDLDNYCYYFERPFENAPRLNKLYRKMDRLVDDWKRAHAKGDQKLSYEMKAGGLEIYDSRGEGATTSFLGKVETDVYKAVLEPISVDNLEKRLGGHITRSEMNECLQRFTDLGLLFREGEQLVGLALPRQIYE